MQLDTLYKRTKTGAIVYCKITVEKFDEHQAPIIVKESGQLGTDKPILHRETIHEGKQKRTPIQQAESQAQSDWKKKKDEGYKSLSELPTAAFFRTEGNANNDKFLEAVLQDALPKFNTDAAGELLPQLAKSALWEPSPKNTYPQIYENKFDGNRTTIVLDFTQTYALSRTGKPQKNLGHLISILDEWAPFESRTERMIIDGEVYLHGLLLEEINEAIKKANENTPKLKFMMYDLPLVEQAQDIRSRGVAFLAQNINSDLFPASACKFVHSDQDVLYALDESLELGYEGGMVKNPNALYQPGQRSSDWKKVKIWDDTEFKTIGYELGQRGVQDLKFICEAPGGTFEVTMNGTLASKQKLFDKIDSLIGKMLTVQHKGYTKYQIPNIAKGKLFRDE